MIFSIVSLLIHAAWIEFFETCFVVNTNFYVLRTSNSHSLQHRDLFFQCAAHTKMIVTSLGPDRAIKGKLQKGLKYYYQS